jgi:hypothetical protein
MEAKLKNFKGDQIKPTEYKKSKKKDQITIQVILTILIYENQFTLIEYRTYTQKTVKIYSNLM